jgi:hypothetical protein
MVAQDPGRPHQSARDTAPVRKSYDFTEVRVIDDRTLIIVKPELEECFVECMAKVGLPSSLGNDASRLRTILGTEKGEVHKVFRGELKSLFERSRHLGISTFVTEIDDTLCTIAQVPKFG